MPKRIMDEAIWSSDRLAKCPEWMRPLYTWLHPLADAYGVFEMNGRVIHGRVAPILPKLSLRKLEAVLVAFAEVGLLFIWESSGKRYGYWTGSEKGGRLPPPSWRDEERNYRVPVPWPDVDAYLAERGLPPEPKGNPRWSSRLTQGGPKVEPKGSTKVTPSTALALALVKAGEGEGQGVADHAVTGEEPWAEMLEAARESYLTRERQEPSWTHRDVAKLMDLVGRKRDLTVEEFTRRWEHYVASTEVFTVKQGLGLGYFCDHFDQFKNGPLEEEVKHGNKRAVDAERSHEVLQDWVGQK